MKFRSLLFILTILSISSFVVAQTNENSNEFDKAALGAQTKLEKSIQELNDLREKSAEELIPLSRELRDLESQLTEVRNEFQQTTRLLDTRTLDLANLRNEIKSRKDETTYLSTLFSEYIRNLESRLHISELQLYEDELEAAKLAPENSNLSEEEIYQEQSKILQTSLERVDELLGGTRFSGTAVDPSGTIQKGDFLLLGPAGLFRSEDGSIVGTAEQRLGSLEPAVIVFQNPEDIQIASTLVETLEGSFPLDPTQGNAHKIAETEETFAEHVAKGGPVMYPIFALAGISLLVALFKWLTFLAIRTPSKKSMKEFLHAVSNSEADVVRKKLAEVKKAPPWSPSYFIKGALIGAVVGYLLSFVVQFRIAEELMPAFVEFANGQSFAVFMANFIIGGAILQFTVRFFLGYSPTGQMLEDAVDNFEYPSALIEEVMYERMIQTKLKLESFLPLIAISAAAAPLLGLLGTVTGIINTFKLITVFGSGDVKTLSGGISEALVTTEFGLIAAIPALLLHAFLARRAKGLVNHMERGGVALINTISKKPLNSLGAPMLPMNIGNDMNSRANVERLSSHFGVEKIPISGSKTDTKKTFESSEDSIKKPAMSGVSSSDDGDGTQKEKTD